MTGILQFIKNNIAWVQSFLSIIFTFVATVVSILTYKRAKATVLQPIRNDVIKKSRDITRFIKISSKWNWLFFNIIYKRNIIFRWTGIYFKKSWRNDKKC